MSKDVVYLWDSRVSTFNYGDASQHPMKPLRLQLVHELLNSLGVLDYVRMVQPPPIPTSALVTYHTRPYIEFLRSTNCGEATCAHSRVFQFSSDCPPFEGVFDFSSGAAAASVAGAVLINHRKADVAINWCGGLHHAKRMEASGFCYINDIVLAILELLRVHKRVLYIDIDVHHGDGVEEAFYTTERVMTVSFHKGDNFFPGTGKRDDMGMLGGRGYSLNVPLFDGITDDQYYYVLFRPLIQSVMQRYQPSAVVMQCGADSLVGDRIGTFNLSSTCHAQCLQFVRGFGLPMLVLGGGGYTMSSVARCWAMETALLCNAPVNEHTLVPEHAFSTYYTPNARLGIPSEHSRRNENSNGYVEKLLGLLMDQLRRVQGPPSVTGEHRETSWVPPPLFDPEVWQT